MAQQNTAETQQEKIEAAFDALIAIGLADARKKWERFKAERAALKSAA